MNLFRQTYNGKLDHKYLRTCATFKLLRLGKIDEDRAVELLQERHVFNAENVVRIWVATLEKDGWHDGHFASGPAVAHSHAGPRP